MRKPRVALLVAWALVTSGGAQLTRNSAASDHRPETLERRMARAALEMEEKRYRSAIKIYTQLLEDPALPRSARLTPHYERARVHAELGDHRMAIGDFSHALAIISDNADRDDEKAQIHFDRGLSYDRLGMMTQAIDDYSKCLTLASGYIRAYNNRAVAHYRIGKYREAIQDANSYLRQDPKWAEAYFTRGAAKIELKDPSAITDLKIAAGMGHEAAQNALRQADIDW